MVLPRKFYDRPTLTVARELIGARLVRILNGRKLIGLITETEAYISQKDLACHAWHGLTPRRTHVRACWACICVFHIRESLDAERSH